MKHESKMLNKHPSDVIVENHPTLKTTITNMNPNPVNHDSATIIASFIARNDVILAEATLENYRENKHCVEELARRLHKKKRTPGWEFTSLPLQWNRLSSTKLKGAKFHVYEHNPEEEGGFCIWSFGCIYPDSALEFKYIESFAKHLIEISQDFRENDQVWKRGSYLAAQHHFSPTLLDMMSDTKNLERLDAAQKGIDDLVDTMGRNIDMILERDDKIEDLLEKSEQLNAMARVFKKNSKALQKKVRRKKLWLDATVGAGAAAVVSTAIVVPCVILL